MSLDLEYFYGNEAEQYSFYRIPKTLFMSFFICATYCTLSCTIREADDVQLRFVVDSAQSFPGSYQLYAQKGVPYRKVFRIYA